MQPTCHEVCPKFGPLPAKEQADLVARSRDGLFGVLTGSSKALVLVSELRNLYSWAILTTHLRPGFSTKSKQKIGTAMRTCNVSKSHIKMFNVPL